MTQVRIIERPAFSILGKKVWISGPDNEQFARFWQVCRADGLFEVFQQVRQFNGLETGKQTNSYLLGVSRVEQDPTHRAFNYMIAIEAPDDLPGGTLERYTAPASQWAVFTCEGKAPASIVEAEMYAFMQWLPQSGFRHALAPEMEVYLAGDSCEFWLPVQKG